VGEETVWPRNHVLLIRVGRPGGRRLLIPVVLAMVDDLMRSWLDLLQLAGHLAFPLGVRMAGRRLGPVLKTVTGRSTVRTLDPRLLALALEGLWRVWRDVRRSERRTLLELRPGDVDICVRLW
jgi:hypothetical protein